MKKATVGIVDRAKKVIGATVVSHVSKELKKMI